MSHDNADDMLKTALEQNDNHKWSEILMKGCIALELVTHAVDESILKHRLYVAYKSAATCCLHIPTKGTIPKTALGDHQHPPLIHGSLGLPKSITQTAPRSVQRRL